MRFALFAVLLAGSTVGALGVEAASLPPLPALVPFFIRAGLRGGPFAEGGVLDRAASLGCIGPAGGGRSSACPRQAALADHDRVWLRAYLERLPREDRGGGPSMPEMTALDPGAIIMPVASHRGAEAHGSAQSSSVPSGLPRLEPTPNPRFRWFPNRDRTVEERKNPYLPFRPRPITGPSR